MWKHERVFEEFILTYFEADLTEDEKDEKGIEADRHNNKVSLKLVQ